MISINWYLLWWHKDDIYLFLHVQAWQEEEEEEEEEEDDDEDEEEEEEEELEQDGNYSCKVHPYPTYQNVLPLK